MVVKARNKLVMQLQLPKMMQGMTYCQQSGNKNAYIVRITIKRMGWSESNGQG